MERKKFPGLQRSQARKYSSASDSAVRSVEPRMKLLTKELRRKIPKLYSTEKCTEKDPMVHTKFFLPATGWKWYPIEFDGEDTFFGLVVGLETELGYFSLTELQNLRGPFGLGVERDLYFKPKHLSEVRKEIEMWKYMKGGEKE